MTTKASKCDVDPAAVFACANSLWQACVKQANVDPNLNLSDAYNGMDQLMREVMRIGEMFEKWACRYVEFAELSAVWPYSMKDKFGDACLAVMLPDMLDHFDSNDCLRVAYELRLPMRVDGTLRLAIDIRASNPIADSVFKEFRIQTVRYKLHDNHLAPFTVEDDPFDEQFGLPYFGLYGIDKGGSPEHIANRSSYLESRILAQKLAPGLVLPLEPIYFGQ